MAHSLAQETPQELPHPPLATAYLRILEEAIAMAWDILRRKRRSDFDLGRALEDRITHELHEVLCDEVFDGDLVDGFGREWFDLPVRQPNVRNFDGRHLQKSPDLLIRLVDRPDVALRSQDGLFIECKPVDRKHPAGSCYCDDGLVRFVVGGYAWAMAEGMMIGYVRENYTIVPKLADALRRRRKGINTLAFPKPCPCSEPGPSSEPVSVTRHARRFRYLETGSKAPPITIRHLWLRRD